jgi:hypothetical protein
MFGDSVVHRLFRVLATVGTQLPAFKVFKLAIF